MSFGRTRSFGRSHNTPVLADIFVARRTRNHQRRATPIARASGVDHTCRLLDQPPLFKYTRNRKMFPLKCNEVVTSWVIGLRLDFIGKGWGTRAFVGGRGNGERMICFGGARGSCIA